MSEILTVDTLLKQLSPETIIEITKLKEGKIEVIGKLKAVTEIAIEHLGDPSQYTHIEQKVKNILTKAITDTQEEFERWMGAPIKIEKVYGCGQERVITKILDK